MQINTLYWLLIILGLGFVVSGTVFRRRRQVKKGGIISSQNAEEGVSVETPEEKFLRQWTGLLSSHGNLFNGLYTGLLKIDQGTAGNPEKCLHEWFQRAHYQWEGSEEDEFAQKEIYPLIETADRDGLIKWGRLLYQAAGQAGITFDNGKFLVLTEKNAAAYIEWDGKDLYPDSSVEIILPACYQNGNLLEQGHCKLCSKEE